MNISGGELRSVWRTRKEPKHYSKFAKVSKGGRHWWAITGVKRSSYVPDESDNENDTNHVEKQVKEDKEWFLIDSNADHIPIISSDDDLIHYLSNVQGRGALIFRCYVSTNMT